MSCRPPETYADPRDVAQLAEPLRSRTAQLIADAPTGGLVLVSGYRTPFQQWVLRNQRCPGRECDPGCKGRPLTALPGRSNHQRRKAADLGGRDLNWAGANAARYGLARPIVSEPWHFEEHPHQLPTVPIRPWGQEPNAGRSWVPFRAGETDRTIYARGGLDNQVAEVQIRLHQIAAAWGRPELAPGPIDGQHGPRTQAAVSAFKRAIIELQRAYGQPTWPNADGHVGPATIAALRFWTP